MLASHQSLLQRPSHLIPIAPGPYELDPHRRFRMGCKVEESLRIRVLRTAAEKAEIAHLRAYADCASEYELDPGLAEFETTKDEIGLVLAFYRGRRAIATIRGVPTDRGITLTERLWRHAVTDQSIFGPHSLEVGRLVIAPEDRNPELLSRCLAMALKELVKMGDFEHLHASCLTKMTRLYRRFGYKTIATFRSKGGKDCALIHGPIEDVARALKVQAFNVGRLESKRVTLH